MPTGSDNNTTYYFNITNSPNSPGTGNWTWQDVIDLDIELFGRNTNNGQNRMLYIDQIRIQVDYDPNNQPSGDFISASQKIDTSGVVDITIQVDDLDDDNCRAKLEYVAGADCDFASPQDPTIDETDANATSTYDDAKIDDDYSYQIGTTTGWITTVSGANNVYFDWLSASDLNNQEGTYCLRLTGTTTKDTINLAFGATSTELNFDEYRIYYSTSSPVTENDYVLSSTTDLNLADQNFNSAATTSIGGLLENTTYYFSIWAFDIYGHKSSSTEVNITTNIAPTGIFTLVSPPAQKTDGTGIVDISIDVADANNDLSMARIEYEAGASCLFSPSDDPNLDEGSIGADFGFPNINNAELYQIRNISTPGTNIVTFDWLSASDESAADDTYCLRLTANDGADNQNVLATTTLTLDNVVPTDPGALSSGGVSTSSIKLMFGATTTETNFTEYIIYYKEGTSGVTEGNTPHSSSTDSNLGYVDFNGAASTTIAGLIPNTNYVFKIWAYDYFGHKASSTEINIKTSALLINDSLTFTNPYISNYIIADGSSEWNFRAEVSDEDGWTAIDTVLLRLANSADNISPFNDLEFTWDQTTDIFSETGTDSLAAVTISDNSSSTCAVNTCILDFKLVFNCDFATSSANYTAELFSTNDSAVTVENSYPNIYQVKIFKIELIHYRWRNDDGGE
jgi:hypothetical protein